MIPQAPQASMLYSMARTYCRSGKPEKGYELLLRAFNTGISCPEKAEGDEYFEDLKNDERFLSLIRAAKLVNLALSFEEIHDDGNAIAALNHAMLISPDYAIPPFLCARYHARNGNTEQALAHLRSSLDKGFRNYCLIMAEKSLQSLRCRREFMDLMKKTSC